jgi:hypothetical protein
MSNTPQENARATYAQTNGRQQQQHVFQSQGQPIANIPPSPTVFRQNGPIRPPPAQHTSPYSTPYTPTTGPQGPPRPNGTGTGNGNGSGMVSAEQQIAQGVLSNTASGSGSSTPQRRPPPLGNKIHVTGPATPQAQSMHINSAINPSSAPGQIHTFELQRAAQNGSPGLQSLNAQRPSMGSPTDSPLHLGPRPQDSSPGDMMDASQDMSMIDPQLALEQQLMNESNGSMMVPGSGSPTMGEGSPVGPGPQVIQGEPLSAPPGGSYPTFESLFAAAQSHALAHGYAFVIGRSKRDNRGLKKVFLICDRGGNNKEKVPGEQRQRKTKSRKCGCEFGVFGLETKTAWILRGRIDGEHLTHNHPPSDSPTEHPGARKLDPKAIAAVKALEENGK